MVYSMHQRSLEGPLWLTYWGYTYIWCTVRVLHITAFHWCEILNKKHGGPLIISQTAGWTIQCTGDHQRGCFDWHTEATHIYDVLLESCISQLFHWCEISNKTLGGPLIILQTAGWSIQCTGDHQRGRFDWHTEVTHIYDVLVESCTSQLSIDVRYWTRCSVVLSSYRKQPNGPFNALEIIRGAAVTDILRLHIYRMYW